MNAEEPDSQSAKVFVCFVSGSKKQFHLSDEKSTRLNPDLDLRRTQQVTSVPENHISQNSKQIRQPSQ